MKNTSILIICFLVIIQALSQDTKIKPAIYNIERIDTNLVISTSRPIPRNNLLNPSKDQINYYDNISKLDSLIMQTWWSSGNQYFNYSKNEFSYDVNGNMSVNISSDYTISGIWDPQTMFNYTYDNNNRIIQEERKYWAYDHQTWIPYKMKTFDFDSMNNLTKELWYEYDTVFRHWINDWKIDYSYNEHNLLTLELINSWDTSANSWRHTWKNTLEYDSNINLLINLEEIWNIDSNIWLENRKNEYYYNEDNVLEYQNYHSRKYNFETVIPIWRCEFSYTNSGNISQKYFHKWNPYILEWFPSRKEIYLYDHEGRCKTEIVNTCYDYQNIWYNLDYFEYYYDNNSNLTMFLDKIVYDEDTAINWKAIYNYNYNTTDYLIPNFTFYPFEWGPVIYYENINNQPIDYYTYNKVGDSLQKDDRTLYFYSNEFDAIDTKNNPWFKIYPNPTKGMIRILKNENSEIHGITLYNQLGQRVLNISNGNYDAVNVSSLNSGIYIIELVINNNRIRDKIIIKR